MAQMRTPRYALEYVRPAVQDDCKRKTPWCWPMPYMDHADEFRRNDEVLSSLSLPFGSGSSLGKGLTSRLHSDLPL